MEKASITSISKTDALNHLSTAKAMSELTCSKIIGFHLVKNQKGGTWRLRYTDFAGKRRKLNLSKFVDGTADRTDAAQQAIKHRHELSIGNDPRQEIQSKKAKFAKDESTRNERLLSTYLKDTYTDYQATKRGGKKRLLCCAQRSKSLSQCQWMK